MGDLAEELAQAHQVIERQTKREAHCLRWHVAPNPATDADCHLLEHLAAQMGVDRSEALHRAIVLLDVQANLASGEELAIRHVESGALTFVYLGWEDG